MIHTPLGRTLPETTVAIRPVMTRNNRFLNYTAFTFRTDPRKVIAHFLCTMERLGYLHPKNPQSCFLLDVLDGSDDILDTFPITRKGWEWAREQLGFERDTSVEDAYAEYVKTGKTPTEENK